MSEKPDDALVQRLLEVLNDGQRDATYKLALLLAIIEWVTTNSGGETIPTADLAEIVLRLYFRQIRQFPQSAGESATLKQGSSPSLRITNAVIGLVSTTPNMNRPDLVRAKNPEGFKRAVLEIEKALVEQPIPRFQIVGKDEIPFLYEWDWSPKQTLGPIKKAGKDHLALLPGVRDRLVTLGPLLRPIIEQFWVWDVAKWTKIETEESRLREHLFGTKRVAFPQSIVDGLKTIQGGKCFYCAGSVLSGAQVDHFVPWSVFPNDAIDNLVLSCKQCNGKKSDHLAALKYLSSWLERSPIELEKVAQSGDWEVNPKRAQAIATNIYETLSVGSVVWAGGDGFVRLDTSDLSEIRALFNNQES